MDADRKVMNSPCKAPKAALRRLKTAPSCASVPLSEDSTPTDRSGSLSSGGKSETRGKIRAGGTATVTQMPDWLTVTGKSSQEVITLTGAMTVALAMAEAAAALGNPPRPIRQKTGASTTASLPLW